MHYTKAIYFDEVTKAFDDLRFIVTKEQNDDKDLTDKVLKIIDYLETHIQSKSLRISVMDLRAFDVKKNPPV